VFVICVCTCCPVFYFGKKTGETTDRVEKKRQEERREGGEICCCRVYCLCVHMMKQFHVLFDGFNSFFRNLHAFQHCPPIEI